jgi:DNA repair exonuclease SbcCD nuclease subunit
MEFFRLPDGIAFEQACRGAHVHPLPDGKADVTVAAGDIHGTILQAVNFFKHWNTPVILIAGNHEHYRNNALLTDIDSDIELGRNATEGTCVHFLENESVILDGVRFLGCTLWTDYGFNGDKETSMLDAAWSLNDHKQIRMNDGKFTPALAEQRHHDSRQWLSDQLDTSFEGKTVVVTHHGISKKSMHPQYEGSNINSSFYSHLDHLVKKSNLWIHGHTHSSSKYHIGDDPSRGHVVVNPRGYPYKDSYRNHFENRWYVEDLLVRV